VQIKDIIQLCEAVKPTAMSIKELKAALEKWFVPSGRKVDNEINFIINHELSKGARNPPSIKKNMIFRCEILNASGQIKPRRKTQNQIIAYSKTPNGAFAYYESLGVSNNFIIVRKEFKKEDFVLDFEKLTNVKILAGSHFNNAANEEEIWMKPTPYYTSIDTKEIVYDTRKL
jgi:hypothetical protein